jgi:hypothetical protein
VGSSQVQPHVTAERQPDHVSIAIGACAEMRAAKAATVSAIDAHGRRLLAPWPGRSGVRTWKSFDRSSISARHIQPVVPTPCSSTQVAAEPGPTAVKLNGSDVVPADVTHAPPRRQPREPCAARAENQL